MDSLAAFDTWTMSFAVTNPWRIALHTSRRKENDYEPRRYSLGRLYNGLSQILLHSKVNGRFEKNRLVLTANEFRTFQGNTGMPQLYETVEREMTVKRLCNVCNMLPERRFDHMKSRIIKTYTFVSYDNYPHSLKKFHMFKKRFQSLSELATFLHQSRLKVCLANPKEELSSSEVYILNNKFWSLRNNNI